DRSVCTPELLQNAAAGGVRERAERAIEAGFRILNHSGQDIINRLAPGREAPARAVPAAFPPNDPLSSCKFHRLDPQAFRIEHQPARGWAENPCATCRLSAHCSPENSTRAPLSSCLLSRLPRLGGRLRIASGSSFRRAAMFCHRLFE